MDRQKRRKPTQAEMEKALNPALTDTTTTLCGVEFKVLVLPLNKEQVFLKMFRRVIPAEMNGASIIEALLNADIGTLCEIAAVIAINSEQDMNAEYIYTNGKLVDIVTAIEKQLDENGYLDFLVRMATVLPEILSAKQ
jgi:hypothetical protein